MDLTTGPTMQSYSLNITTTTNATLTDPRSMSQAFTTGGILKAFSVAMLMFASIVGNLVVCISFTMFRNLRSITNYFLVSLSISDILVGSCTMPFWMLIQLYEPRRFFTPDKATLRTFWYIMDFFLCLSSVCSLAVISVERNLAISKPFYYTKWVSPNRVYVTIASLWMYALTVSVVTRLNPFGKQTSVSIFILCASYALPFFIIIAMYGKILLVARRQARRLRQDGALATDFKAIKTIAIVIGAFFICYTPYMVVLIWFHFQLGPVAPYTISIVKWLTYFNSCLNPIIYSCFNKTYRRGFKRLFQTIVNKIRELRMRASDRKASAARKLQRSGLSINLTMRSSAGSLLDGVKITSANGQSRGSIQFVSQNTANCAGSNERMASGHPETPPSPPADEENEHQGLQDTKQ